VHVQETGRVQRIEIAIRHLSVQHPHRLLGEVALVEVVDPDVQRRRLEQDCQEQ
jgi:hypothetical protein